MNSADRVIFMLMISCLIIISTDEQCRSGTPERLPRGVTDGRQTQPPQDGLCKSHTWFDAHVHRDILYKLIDP